MKWLHFFSLVLPLSILLGGCASLSGGGSNSRSDVYYTRAEAQHDAEIEQLREQKEQAEREAAQAKRELLRQQEATRRAEQEAQRQRELAQQALETPTDGSQEILGPEDFDSYAQYRDYLDKGYAVRTSKQATPASYSDNSSTSYNSAPQRHDSYYYQSEQQPTTVNNYYLSPSDGGYYATSYYDYPDYALIVTFDPWVYASYRSRRWYDMPWRYSWYAWDSYWWRCDYAYLYGYPYYGYPYYGSPYYPSSSYAWGAYDGYRWGYHDGFYDGYNWGGGSTPSYQPPIRNNTQRTVYTGQRPEMASMAGYGRQTRSVTSLANPPMHTSGAPIDGATRGSSTRTRTQRVVNPAYSNQNTQADLPATGYNTRTQRVSRPTSTPSQPASPTYNPTNTRTQRVSRPTSTPSQPASPTYSPSDTRTQRVSRPTSTPSQPASPTYSPSDTRTQRVSRPTSTPSQPVQAPSNPPSSTPTRNTRSGR